jgi:hypothetical protein
MLKTKLGAALAGLYLLGVLVVSLPFLFNVVANNGAGGLHSTSAMSMLFVMLLTAPGSWPAIGAVDVQFAGSTELVKGYLAAGALAGCAIANAAAIYVFIWLCGLLFRFAFGTAKDDPVGLK